MANDYKILGQVAPPLNNSNTVYTVPNGRSCIVSTFVICNQDALTRTFRLATVQSGQSLSSKNYIAYDVSIPANDSVNLTAGITLGANDSVVVYGSSSNIAFSVFGSEIY